MDERTRADDLDRLLDNLATGANGAVAFDSDVARVARRYHELGQSSPPPGARDRVLRGVPSRCERSNVGNVASQHHAEFFDIAHAAGGPNGRIKVSTTPWPQMPIAPSRRRWTLAQLATALVLLLTAAGAYTAVVRTRPVNGDPPEAPAIVAAAIPTIVGMETLLDMPVDSLPGGLTKVSVERWTFRTGLATWETSPLDGPQWVVVDAGRLVATINGAGRTLAPGEVLVVPASQQLTLHNPDPVEAVAFLGAVVRNNIPPRYGGALISWRNLPISTSTDGLPAGSARVVMERLTLPPGTGLPPEVATGRTWYGVLAGQLGLTLEGEALPLLWDTGKERVVHAFETVPPPQPGWSLSLRNAGDIPLVLVRLTIVPTGDGPLGLSMPN